MAAGDAIGYSLRIEGLDKLQAAFRRSPELVNREGRAAMDKSVKKVEASVKPLVPVYRGRLRQSIGSQVLGSGSIITGRVGSSLRNEAYPAVMEFGRRPGAKMPPVAPLERWVHLVLGDASLGFVIARSIGRKGIKGRHFMRDGWNASKPAVNAYWTQALENIVKGLARGD